MISSPDRHRPRIAVSIGDPNGIGPEVALKCVFDAALRERVDPVLVGSAEVISQHAVSMGAHELPCTVVDSGGMSEGVQVGQISEAAGEASMRAVEAAVGLCKEGRCVGMVTAPISKEAVGLAGYSVPGHTEFIAGLCGGPPHLMLLVSDNLRVGLVTGHLPLREVAQAVTTAAILERLLVLRRSLAMDFGIDRPRIAVLGLNPHAGDGGVLGEEEETVVAPALRLARERSPKTDISGPFPADGFFGNRSYRQYDGVLAMYHDQGLAPFKTIAFGSGVNFTAGLPIIRTSPDHGTAFDIAGQNLARPDSMRSALLLAAQISQTRTMMHPSSQAAH